MLSCCWGFILSNWWLNELGPLSNCSQIQQLRVDGTAVVHGTDMHIEGSLSPKWVCKQDVRAALATQLAGISVKEQLLRYLEHHKAQGYWFERQSSSLVISVIAESLNWYIMHYALPSATLSVSNNISPTHFQYSLLLWRISLLTPQICHSNFF